MPSPRGMWGGAGEGGVDGEDCLARYVLLKLTLILRLGAGKLTRDSGDEA